MRREDAWDCIETAAMLFIIACGIFVVVTLWIVNWNEQRITEEHVRAIERSWVGH